MQLLRRTDFYRVGLFLIASSFSAVAKTSRVQDFLLDLSVEHPPCLGSIDLDVANETFVEIQDPLAGRDEYNQLISLFSKKQWAELDEAVTNFQRTFEVSPLREAVAFLYVQSKFSRLEGAKDPEVTEADRLLKEGMLLYPSSKFWPAVATSVANFWLKNNEPMKAHALFRQAQEAQPLHDLACVFQLGIAETLFQMGDIAKAKGAATFLLQKCQNPRLRIGATIRLINIGMRDGSTPLSSEQESLFRTQPLLVRRYYPYMLHELGEVKFQSKQFASSKYYFDEFLKSTGAPKQCNVYAQKRLADISLALKEPVKIIAGKYLEASESSKDEDMSRFCYIRGLLLGLSDVNGVEVERRIKVIDSQVASIQFRDLRTQASVEKGLFLLDHGELSSVAFLLDLRAQRVKALEKSEAMAFMRERISRFIEHDPKTYRIESMQQAYNDLLVGTPYEKRVRTLFAKTLIRDMQDSLSGTSKKRIEMRAMHTHYESWVKKTDLEKQFKVLYLEILQQKLNEAVKNESFDHAVALLQSWKQSPLWPKAGPSQEFRQKIGQGLLKSFFDLPVAQQESRASKLQKFTESIKEFSDHQDRVLPVALALRTGDDPQLKKLLSQRELASLSPKVSRDIQEPTRLLLAEAFEKTSNWSSAEQELLTIKSKELSGEVNERLFRIYQLQQKSRAAYKVGHLLVPSMKEGGVAQHVKVLLQLAIDAKLWSEGETLLKLASDKGIKDKELAPFYFLAGRSSAELQNCKTSVERYEAGLKLSSEGKEAAEGRYRMGKCYLRLKQPTQAKKIWQELSAMSDSFWSPLAKSELQLLAP